jgi:hypothetical protein
MEYMTYFLDNDNSSFENKRGGRMKTNPMIRIVIAESEAKIMGTPGKRVLLWCNNLYQQIKNRQKEKINSFRFYLDCCNPEHTCFFCENTIRQEPALHYVIPRFFLQTDDLWNIVYTHEHCKLEHQDVLPDKELIKRLEKRNNELLKKLKDREIHNREIEELQYAVDFKLAVAFWLKYKGMLNQF